MAIGLFILSTALSFGMAALATRFVYRTLFIPPASIPLLPFNIAGNTDKSNSEGVALAEGLKIKFDLIERQRGDLDKLLQEKIKRIEQRSENNSFTLDKETINVARTDYSPDIKGSLSIYRQFNS